MSMTRSDGSVNDEVRLGAPGPVGLGVRPEAPDPEVTPGRAPRRRFSAAYKAAIVRQAEQCTRQGELGALLRREGLYASSLANFRQQLAAGRLQEVDPVARRQQRRAPATERQQQARELARLQRENEQLRAIIDVQKKLSELLSIPLETQELSGRRG